MKTGDADPRYRSMRRARMMDWAMLCGLVLAFGLTLVVVLGGDRLSFVQPLGALLSPAEPAAMDTAATASVTR